MGSIANVRLGQCNVSYGEVDFGHTKGGTELTIKNEITEGMVDAYGTTPARAWHKGTRVEAKTTFAEYEYDQLRAAINATGSSGDEVTVGGLAGIELEGDILTLHPSSLAAEDTSQDVVLFKAVIIGDTKLSYKVDEETVYEVTWLALVSLDDADEDGNGFLARLGTPSEA